MRSPSRALVALTLLGATACTADQPPPESSGIATPTGPCAAERALPPDGSQEQRVQGDLDADGRTDEVVSWIRDGQRVVQVWLATGQNAEPQQLFSGDLLKAEDVNGDGRADVFANLTPGGEQAVFVLDGCTLVPEVEPPQAPAGALTPSPAA